MTAPTVPVRKRDGNVRLYGAPPFSVAVLHGGPGAAGEMTPVARELAADRGVLEPLQTVATLRGQIDELRAACEAHGDLPIVLVGFSWGAWLGYLVAAQYPRLVKKLVLVSSGPYEERYAAIDEVRLSRLRRSGPRRHRSTRRRLGRGNRRTKSPGVRALRHPDGQSRCLRPAAGRGRSGRRPRRHLRRRLARRRRTAPKWRIAATRRAHRVPGGGHSRQLRPASGCGRTGSHSLPW